MTPRCEYCEQPLDADQQDELFCSPECGMIAGDESPEDYDDIAAAYYCLSRKN